MFSFCKTVSLQKDKIMKNTLLPSFLFLFLFFALQNLFAQEVYTEFTNPSFEDIPRPQHIPYGWSNCGFEGETPPDVHPILPHGVFGVNQLAQHGDTYLGMVVRENNTWESTTQKLEKPLEPNSCYAFDISLCTSKTYTSSLRGRSGEVFFTNPILLRVWGSKKFCKKKELLAEGKLINHHDWKKYSFHLAPEQETTYLILEAYYDERFKIPNGNILLDNLSPIYTLNCNDVDSTQMHQPLTLTPVQYLRNIIIDYGKSISFTGNKKLSKKSQKALEEIKEAISFTENTKVIFCIRGNNPKKTIDRLETLEKILEVMEFDEETYSVIPYNINYDKQFWYTENSDLSITIQNDK